MLITNRNNTKPRVFLVEDDEDDRFLFQGAITDIRDEIDYHEFYDGESFLKTISSSSQLPDAIFLDLNLPRRNGIECLDFLRSRLGDSIIKVFILSTSSSRRMIEQTRDLGANLYIRKSENYNDLKNLIGIALQQINSSSDVPFYLNELTGE
jgi:CheY-like chemotaxis protein